MSFQNLKRALSQINNKLETIPEDIANEHENIKEHNIELHDLYPEEQIDQVIKSNIKIKKDNNIKSNSTNITNFLKIKVNF